MKKLICIAFLTSSFIFPLGASVEYQQNEVEQTFTQKAYETFVKSKNATVKFVKKHPYLTMATLVAISNPNLRKITWGLPKAFWSGVQNNPIPTVFISGFFLSILI